jgi:hypothetical protein
MEMNSLTHSREAIGQPARDVPNLIKNQFLNILSSTYSYIGDVPSSQSRVVKELERPEEPVVQEAYPSALTWDNRMASVFRDLPIAAAESRF